MTTSDNEWQPMTMSDSEWQRVVQRMKRNEKNKVILRPVLFPKNFIQICMQYVVTIYSAI